MDTVFKEDVSGRRLLRIEALSAARVKVALRRRDGATEVRDIACGPGISCVEVGDSTGERYEVTLSSATAIQSAQLLSVPQIQIKQTQGYGSPVVCGLATIPSRLAELAIVVESLLPQVDHLVVYLNNFDFEPAFLQRPGVTVFHSRDYGDYRDNSKYFGLACFEGDAYFFSVDDDINYPQDYVSTLVSALDRYEKRVVVGVHGAIYGAGSRLFLDRAALHFAGGLDFDVPVSALGTGTCAFHTSALRPQSLEFERVGMADLVLARISAAKNVPQIALARPAGWLTAQEMIDAGHNLYAESIELESAHDLYVRGGNVPGPGLIRKVIASTPPLAQLLSSDALALLRYLEALEQAQPVETLAVPYRESLNALARSFRWPGLSVALARGVAFRYWAERREFVLAVLPIRAMSFGLDRSVLERLVAYIDQVVSSMRSLWAGHGGECPDDEMLEGALAVARHHGHEELIVALAGIRFFSAGGGVALQRLHAELCSAGMSEPAEAVGKALCLLSSNFAEEVLLETSAMQLRAGSVGELLQSADRLMSGYAGRQLLATAALLTGKAWAEELVLSLFVDARSKRHVKRAHELAKILRKVPLAQCHPEFWADAMSAMTPEIRRLAAGALIANRRWSHRVSLDDLGLESEVDRVLWRSAIKATEGLSFSEATHAVNRVFIAGGLPAVELDSTGGEGDFLHALRAEPLPGGRDPSAPLVSVIMAAYNCQSTLDYSLRSVAAQSYPNIEIIVIDDCSPSPVALPQWAQGRPDITLHRLAVNVGPYECRNVAIGMSKGDFIATHDADDWMHPQKIQRQVESFLRSNAVASYTRHIRVLPDGAPALENNGMFMGDGPITSMFRRPLFDALGGFMPVRTRGDMEFKARVLARYRRVRVAHDDAVTLLALDSATSNSKVYTRSAVDEINIAKFKRWYSVEHSVAYFRVAPVLPTGMGSLFDAAGPAASRS